MEHWSPSICYLLIGNTKERYYTETGKFQTLSGNISDNTDIRLGDSSNAHFNYFNKKFQSPAKRYLMPGEFHIFLDNPLDHFLALHLNIGSIKKKLWKLWTVFKFSKFYFYFYFYFNWTKYELLVTSYELNPQKHDLKFKSASSNQRVKSSNPRVKIRELWAQLDVVRVFVKRI